MAQEAISSIRTVHAFWAHAKMIRVYDEFLEQAHKVGRKKSPNYAVLFSNHYFCVYSGIALAFWQGFRMYQRGEISSAGTVFTFVYACVRWFPTVVLTTTFSASSSPPRLLPHLLDRSLHS